MLEKIDYRAVDMALSIMYGFVDRVTGYTQPPKMTRVHTIHSSLNRRVISRNGRREWISEGFKGSGLEFFS